MKFEDMLKSLRVGTELERNIATFTEEAIVAAVAERAQEVRDLKEQMAGLRSLLVTAQDAVAVAVQAEREACAKIVEAYPHAFRFDDTAEVAAAIRARGSR